MWLRGGSETAKSPYKKGMTLLEVMISLSLLVITILSISTYVNWQLIQQKRNRIRFVMEGLSNQIMTKTRSPAIIYASLTNAKNSDFSSCVYVGTCSQSQYQFNPTSPNYFELSEFSATGTTPSLNTFAGSDTSGAFPHFYDTNANPCQTNNPTCIFHADAFYYVTFNGQSDPNITNLTSGNVIGVTAIHIGFRITQIHELAGMKPNLPDLPNPDLSHPFFFSFDPKEILGTSSSRACNLGADQVGYQDNGKILCQCRSPFLNTGANDRGAICALQAPQPFVCDPNSTSVFRGFGSNPDQSAITSGEAYCLSKNDPQTYDCIPASTSDVLNQNSCPGADDSYYIIEEIAEGCGFNCSATPSNLDCVQNTNFIQNLPTDPNTTNNGIYCSIRQRMCCKPKQKNT